MCLREHYFDPFEPVNQAQRYEQYDLFRSRGPLAWGRPPRPGLNDGIYLFSHAAVSAALKHRAILQAPEVGAYAARRRTLLTDNVFGLISHAVLFADPPRHGGLRRPIAAPLARSAAARHAGRMRAHAEVLARDCNRRGRFDLIKDFATPLIAGGLLELLGLDVADVSALKRHTSALAADLDLMKDRPRHSPHRSAYAELTAIVERSLADGPPPRASLAAHLADQVDNGHWRREDLVANLVFLLLAGQETAVDALGNAVLALSRHPGAWRAVDDGRVSGPEAVDELLRYDASLQMSGFRLSCEHMELCGASIPAGTPVIAVLGSANRDPTVFRDPERLSLERRPRNVSRTFGYGIHNCAGQHLARYELAAALETLAAWLPEWHIDEAGVTERRTVSFRGHVSVPVVVRPGVGSAESPRR